MDTLGSAVVEAFLAGVRLQREDRREAYEYDLAAPDAEGSFECKAARFSHVFDDPALPERAPRFRMMTRALVP